MAATQALLASLNSGEISPLALARVDLAKLRVATERQVNWLPHVLGPAMLRPGTQYIAGMPGNAAGWLGEFYFDETAKTLLVATAAGLQFLTGDAWLTRPAVTAAVTNGNFDTDVNGWTDSDEAGAASTWVTGGYLQLVGTGTNYAYRDQQVTVNEIGTEHALRVVVAHNSVVLKVGTSAGDGSYLDVTLLPGTYSLAFTPSGASFWIRVGANTAYAALVDGINVEGAGAVSLPVPWSTTAHFDSIRYDQSGDVLFVASAGFQQRRIERRASNSRSWGIALYLADDGPFRLGNVASDLTITPSATTGFITLTASRSIWKTGHVGGLYKITHPSQTVTAALAALNATTGEIRVSGLASHGGSASARSFTVLVEGTFTATITLERSISAPGAWSTVESYTAPTSKTFDDGLDNQIIYYRLKCTAYTSGTANSTLVYNSSSQTGIVRINGYSSGTSVTADVLKELGGTTATDDWAEGEWSDYRGWPAAVALHDGRLFWQAGLKTQGSVSDAFASFDDAIEGDAGPLNRTVATGGLDGGRWLLSLQRLLLGTAGKEISIRASAFDEPLTPTAFVARDCSTRGAAKVRPAKVDSVGIFVERNGKRVFELSFDVQRGDYHSRELTRLKQEMCDAGVRDIAVQRQPDTRIWFVLGDGTCAVLTYDQDDEVAAWIPVETGGSFERVAVLPGTDEDDVYFIVAREVGGTKRYIEKLAKRSECVGGTISKTIDSHIVYSGAPTTAINAPHLAGKQVVVWADGKALVTDAAPITLDGSGNGTAPASFSNACYGLAYVGQLKTAKLAYGAEKGTALTLQKRIVRVGLVAADVSIEGLKIGRDFDHLTRAATTYKGKAITAGQVLPSVDAPPSSFGGAWDSDSRFCAEVRSPHCCTLMGLVLEMQTSEMADEPAPRGRQ
jgi:hypothetical protein